MAIELSGLEILDERFAKLAEALPQHKRAYHERVGEAVKTELDLAVDQVGIRDSQGKVKRWQVVAVGSGGGYSKVRPEGSKEGAETGKNSPDAITNYLAKGHAIRQPSGRDGNYRPRIRVPRVPGRNFYEAVGPQVDNIAIREAEGLMDELAAILEG